MRSPRARCSTRTTCRCRRIRRRSTSLSTAAVSPSWTRRAASLCSRRSPVRCPSATRRRAPPSISDSTPQVGETLIGSSGAWSGTPGPSFSGAWQVAATTAGPWSAGAGTVSQTTFPGDTYVPAAGDAGQVLRFTVTATNSAGSASANANPTGSIGGAVGTAPTIVTAPTITNAGSPPHVGDSLIGTQGVWNGSPTSYA